MGEYNPNIIYETNLFSIKHKNSREAPSPREVTQVLVTIWKETKKKKKLCPLFMKKLHLWELFYFLFIDFIFL